MDTYETKDIVTATYLKHCGHYCIGTIPANNPRNLRERLWMFEDSEQLRSDVREVQEGDPVMPVKAVFRCSSILKNLLNDKDEP